MDIFRAIEGANMNSGSIAFLCTVIFLIVGCASHSSIDAKKSGTSVKEGIVTDKSNVSALLSDKDIFW